MITKPFPYLQRLQKKLALKDGAIIEARVENGKLLILRKKKTKLQNHAICRDVGKRKC